MFFGSKNVVFISKNVFFQKNRFHACYCLKKTFKNNIPKEVETKLVVQSTLWALIENVCYFGALVCSQITTGIYCWAIVVIIFVEVTPTIGYYSL
jgi:hypothetical protein